jgi:hypothetical protein
MNSLIFPITLWMAFAARLAAVNCANVPLRKSTALDRLGDSRVDLALFGLGELGRPTDLSDRRRERRGVPRQLVAREVRERTIQALLIALNTGGGISECTLESRYRTGRVGKRLLKLTCDSVKTNSNRGSRH